MLLALQIGTVMLTLAGVAYSLLCLRAARGFRQSQARLAAGFTPQVSVLKPVRGADPEAYENFRSHTLQDYPQYEIVFGVADAADPAVSVIERLITDHPDHSIRLVVCPQKLGTNRKVSSLIQMLAAARYSHLVIADSDIRVPPDYLRRLLAPLADPAVGMVTCLFRGVPAATLGSRLKANSIAVLFAPGVLAARLLDGGLRFALGSTIATSRPALEKMGGLGPLVDHLADDYELGARTAAAGLRVVLSDLVVDHYVPGYSLRGFLQHQLRWGRGMRQSRPAGYAGLFVTYLLVWALAAAAALCFSQEATSFSQAAAAVLTTGIGFRLAVAHRVGIRILGDRALWRRLWLLPLSDVLGLLVWAGSYTGRQVTWRGERFRLEKGRLRPET
ncbi:MAG: bacteriohopanetetrol glucosamine biosynthesis glycosyltransferase HpnI [Acidobacteria bacterium]|nr:bacteriohopanetetrol glucosamine biosynthesis glycosyltransferase HpnI [Acidobacteriota bacterium]